MYSDFFLSNKYVSFDKFAPQSISVIKILILRKTSKNVLIILMIIFIKCIQIIIGIFIVVERNFITVFSKNITEEQSSILIID